MLLNKKQAILLDFGGNVMLGKKITKSSEIN